MSKLSFYAIIVLLERVGVPTLSYLLKGGESMNKVEKYILNEYSAVLEEQGYVFYHIEYNKVGKENFLRLYIENKDLINGIDIEACEKISRLLSDRMDIDESFPIKDAYIFEVSSPGLERELHTLEHYKRYIGEKICVKLYKAIEKNKELIGILESVDEDGIVINDSKKTYMLPYDLISKAHLFCDFS